MGGMVSAVRLVWCGALALAGCGFDLQLSGAPPGSDGSQEPVADATGDTMITQDAQLVPLVDRGLVVRYFIDEAASGQAVTTLVDSAQAPLSLPITHGTTTAYLEVGGNRGLRWSASQSDGKVEIALGTETKLRTRLTTTPTITMEVVVQITNAGDSGSESHITGMRGGNPDFVLAAIDTTDLRLFKPFGTVGATWANANTQQRMVLHLVFDTTRTMPNERIELFRNGVNIAKTTGSAPNINSEVSLGSSDDFVIGNNQNEDRSIEGTIFYVAYYDVALSSTEITTNAARLLADDDT